MWDSYKLYKAARDLRKYISEEDQIELTRAIDYYGMDSGAAIVPMFKKLFREQFLRTFWKGSDIDFIEALK